MSILPLTVPPKRLAQTISSTATSFKLNNIQSWNGNDLTPGDFGTEAFAVFINLTRTQIEIVKIDPATIADASITITARGLDYLGGETPDPSRQYAWASNETIVQLGTDAPQLFRDFMSESNPATVTALHTYDILPQSAEVPTDPADFTTKEYVDGLTEPAVTYPINQVAHGFVVGDVIRIDGVNTFAKAQADSAPNAEVVGIVTNVVDVDNFEFVSEGVITTGVPVFPAGTVLFLSRTTAGALVDTDTTTIGEVSFPLAVVSESGVRMYFHKYRPAVINTISGNPIASETVAGTVEKATPAEVAAKADVGSTGAPLFVVPSLLPGGASFEKSYNPLESIDGSVTKKAVTLDPTGRLLLSDASAPAKRGFIGFANNNVVGPAGAPSLLGTPLGSQTGTTAITIPSGNDITVYVVDYAGDNSSSAQLYSTMSFDGNPMTRVAQFGFGNYRIGLWAYAAGAGGQSGNITVTGGNGANYVQYDVIFAQNAAQSAPFVSSINGSASASTGQSRYVHGSLLESLAVIAGGQRFTAFNVSTAGVTDILTGSFTELSTLPITDGSGYQASGSAGSGDTGIIGFTIQTAAAATDSTVERLGVISGFSALTPGDTYWTSSTPGAITNTPADSAVPVGVAISATELYITPNLGIEPSQQVFLQDPTRTITGTAEATVFETRILGGSLTSQARYFLWEGYPGEIKSGGGAATFTWRVYVNGNQVASVTSRASSATADFFPKMRFVMKKTSLNNQVLTWALTSGEDNADAAGNLVATTTETEADDIDIRVSVSSTIGMNIPIYFAEARILNY